MPGHFVFLSFFPIVTVLVISIWKGVKAGVFIGFLLTSVLYFFWGNYFLAYVASLASALVGTVNILMTIFGAVFLYHVMEQKGYIAGIKQSLSEIHPDKTFRFFFLAFFLTAFFESVAGFGTPGAIVPLLLIAMGYSPVVSIAAVLLIDGLFAISGAVGTPVSAGLETPLGLSANSVSQIYLYSALGIFVSGLVFVFFIYRFIRSDNAKAGAVGWILYFTGLIPFVVISWFAKELTGLLAAVIMVTVCYMFLFKNKNLQWKPWLPYAILTILLLLPKLFVSFARVLSYKLEFNAILGTEISTSVQPFRSPLIPFLAAALFALYRMKDFNVDYKPVISKTFAVFLILLPSLAITQLMLNSGNELPSMIAVIAGVFETTGDAYPLVSPLIGVIGAFISGSTTVSNIIFGSAQYASAQSLDIKPEIILGLQLAGASIGNSVCLFNIIAAAAVAGVKDYKEILKLNLLPVALASLMCSMVGYFLIWFF